MTLDIDYLRTWIGRNEAIEDTVTKVPVAAMSATLDRDDPPPVREIRCRRSGTGCISCRCIGNPSWDRTAMPSAAAFCRLSLCRGACGRAGASSSTAP